jgi:predicted Zn-dependent peptidase
MFCTVNAVALPSITSEKINGFQVDFVDLGRGDTFAVTFGVPVGTMHEWGRLMGRMHLLEHLLHVGTNAFPGYHTFDQMLKPAGVATNAYTSLNHTFYYASANADSAELMLKVHLAMLGGLEWNQETISKEREVVINEVADEYMPQESTALSQMPFVKLLPRRHPLNQPTLGDKDSLRGLTIEDLKELYYQNYGPGSARVALIGNFSDPKFKEQVRAWTQKYLHAPNPLEDAVPYPPVSIPLRKVPRESLFSSGHMAPESETRLYLNTELNRWSGIFLEAPADQFPRNSEAAHLLMSYLNISAPGSLMHKLKTELGWISNGGGYIYGVNNRQYMRVQFRLTEAGAGHEVEINEMFFSALRSVQMNPPAEDLINKMKSASLKAFENQSYSVTDFLRPYAALIQAEKSMAESLTELRAVMPADIQRVASAFRPDQALYYYAGPEKADMLNDDRGYKRKFKLEDNHVALERYIAASTSEAPISFQPKLREVNLGEAGPVEPRFVFEQKPGELRVVDIRTDLPDVLLNAELTFKTLDPRDLAVIEILSAALNERFASEESYIYYTHALDLTEATSQNVFSVTASGTNGLAAKALIWRLQALSSFAATEGEFQRAREKYVSYAKNKYNEDFAAFAAVAAFRGKVDPLMISLKTNADNAADISFEEFKERWHNLRAQADLRIVGAGAISNQDIQEVAEAARLVSPQPLNDVDRSQLKARFWPLEGMQEHRRFPAPKGEDPWGLLRAYQGPVKTNLKESAAFMVLTSLLHTMVGNHNRGDQELGYMHGTAITFADTLNWNLMMYGGTEGPANAQKTIDGWDYVLNRLRNGQVTDDMIKDAQSDVVNSKAEIKTSAFDLAQQIEASLNVYDDPHALPRELETLRSLTPQDVRDVAQKYILAPNTPHYQLTMSNCEQALTNADYKVTMD